MSRDFSVDSEVDATVDWLNECVDICGRKYSQPRPGWKPWKCQGCLKTEMVKWDAKSHPYKKYCVDCTRVRANASRRRGERAKKDLMHGRREGVGNGGWERAGESLQRLRGARKGFGLGSVRRHKSGQ